MLWIGNVLIAVTSSEDDPIKNSVPTSAGITSTTGRIRMPTVMCVMFIRYYGATGEFFRIFTMRGGTGFIRMHFLPWDSISAFSLIPSKLHQEKSSGIVMNLDSGKLKRTLQR